MLYTHRVHIDRYVSLVIPRKHVICSDTQVIGLEMHTEECLSAPKPLQSHDLCPLRLCNKPPDVDEPSCRAAICGIFHMCGSERTCRKWNQTIAKL
jgi:hypothetical protein